MPMQMTPHPAVNQSSRFAGNREPEAAAITRIVPEIVYRIAIMYSGGIDSMAMRMPRYVVPQSTQTAANAA